MSRDIPILFSAPMVRANLAGMKTQTRRVVKHPAAEGAHGWHPIPTGWQYMPGGTEKPVSPYGKAGDRLWVREAYRVHGGFDARPPREIPKSTAVWYCADEGASYPSHFGKQRPSMFMMRWASRITLLVKEVRIERLQAISEADAIAEGCAPQQFIRGEDDMMINHVMLHAPWAHRAPGSFLGMPAPVARYVVLWDTINGKTCPWASNPWVWVITYERIKP